MKYTWKEAALENTGDRREVRKPRSRFHAQDRPINRDFKI
jgi:hypothetical protein